MMLHRRNMCASAHPVPLITYLIMYTRYLLPSADTPEPVADVEIETRWSQSGRKRSTARFLKGPVSLESLQTASRLPGRALQLYLAIRHRCDLRRSKSVTLPAAYLEGWGIGRFG